MDNRYLLNFISDGELYTATVSDFSGSDPLIYKEPLRTDQFDSKHLNCKLFFFWGGGRGENFSTWYTLNVVFFVLSTQLC